MSYLGGTTTRAAALYAAIIALAAALLFAAGPGAGQADAGTACKRFGKTPAYQLRSGPARRAVVCLLNRKRQQNGMSKLDNDRKLQRAAQKHNDHMVSKGCFAHECPGEGSLEQRLRSVDYLTGGLSAWAYGENIAWGEQRLSTPYSIVKAWMNSSGHRANILNRSFKEIGVGVTDGTPYNRKAKGATFTTDFGLAQG